MMSIYSLPPGGWPVRLLRFLERRSIAFADAVFTPNASFSELFAARNPEPEKIHIVMNTPEERIFEAEPRPAPPRFPARVAGEFRVMHHGSIVHRHGLDLLVRAVAAARARIPGLRLDIYGRREPFLDEVLAVAAELGIADVVHYHGNQTSAQISEAILETDLGVIPNRRSAFTALNFPTRIFEYLAMKRLVIVPDTKGITDYFAPDDLPTFRADDVDSLAERIGWIHDHPEAARTMLDRSRAIYREHRWAGEKARLLNVVARTLSPL
jgi:glycosyltransferase involved in cell wall biosynthesis